MKAMTEPKRGKTGSSMGPRNNDTRKSVNRMAAFHTMGPMDTTAMRTRPEGDGLRVTWTQRLTLPVRIEVAIDAFVLGDRLTGTATIGSRRRQIPIEGRRIG